MLNTAGSVLMEFTSDTCNASIDAQGFGVVLLLLLVFDMHLMILMSSIFGYLGDLCKPKH